MKVGDRVMFVYGPKIYVDTLGTIFGISESGNTVSVIPDLETDTSVILGREDIDVIE